MLNSEKMVASIDNQDLVHAQKYFERALADDPDETLLALGDYLESIGFLPQAKEVYLKLQDNYPEVNVNLAQIAAEDGELEEAFSYLDKVPKDSSDYVSSLLVMADLYQMEGLADVAREKLLLARELTDEPLVTFGLAEVEYELENYQTAIDLYASLDHRDILEQTGISTYQRIGHSYASMGRFEVAIEFLEKSLEISYADDVAFELGVVLFDQEEFQKANLYFKQLDTMNPDFDGYEYVYALSLKEEHQLTEALRLAQQGLSKNEFDSQLLLLASQLSYETHDNKAAEAYLLSARKVAEDLEEVNLRLSNLYLEQERYEEVISLASDDIDNVLTRWNIAKAYQALEEDEKALTSFQELYVDLAKNPEFLEDYAYLLREFGYRDQARKIADSYLQLIPDDVRMVNFREELND